MGDNIISFKIKGLPPNINKYIGRTNIWEYQKNKKKYHQLVKISTTGFNPKFKKCNLEVIYHFKDKRRRDTHNMTKCLLDALVEANIIEDDSYQVLNSYTEKGINDTKEEYIEIFLEEVK